MAYHVETSQPLYLDEGGEGTSDLFFDEANRHVLIVKTDEVKVVSIDGGPSMKIRIGNRGRVILLRLSLDKQFLAIHRAPKMIDLMDIATGSIVPLSSKSTKDTTKILGFFWIQRDEIAIVTNYGIEHFQTFGDKTPKLLKNLSMSINWFLYSHETRVLMTSTGTTGNSIQCFHFKDSSINKLPKFDIILPPFSADPVLNKQQKLKAKDVFLALIYGRVYCVHLCETLSDSEIVLYQITRDAITKKYVLPLNTKGDCVINIVDNLILVHSLESKLSIIYDVKAKNGQAPVVSPIPLGPMFVSPRKVIGIDGQVRELSADDNVAYGKDWLAFYPDIIIARDLSCVWLVSVSLENVIGAFTDKSALLDFLLRRRGSRSLILSFLKSSIEKRTNLPQISKLFDQLNSVCSSVVVERAYDKAAAKLKEKEKKNANSSFLSEYLGLVSSNSEGDLALSSSTSSLTLQRAASTSSLRSSVKGDRRSLRDELLDRSQQGESSLSMNAEKLTKRAPGSVGLFDDSSSTKETISPKGLVVIDQENMYSWVFSTLAENETLPFRYMVAVLVEYIRSLNQFQLPIDHYIYELVINLLVSNERFYQLHQFLQYHVVRDSVHVACLLLSLEIKYPPSFQLAIDMLKRLGTSEQIVEVLLLKKQVMTALRFARSVENFNLPYSRFLEVALASTDRMLFYNVYKYLEEKNITATGKPDFPPSEECEKYVQYFNTHFGPH